MNNAVRGYSTLLLVTTTWFSACWKFLRALCAVKHEDEIKKWIFKLKIIIICIKAFEDVEVRRKTTGVNVFYINKLLTECFRRLVY